MVKQNTDFLSFFDLSREFTKFRNLPENEWLKLMPSGSTKLALRDVYNTFIKFFNKGGGYPKFKSKKYSPKFFKTRSNKFYIDKDRLRFEGLTNHKGNNCKKYLIDLKFELPFRRIDGTKYISPCISKDNIGNYWVSFSIETPTIILDSEKSEGIGIDVGIRQTMTLSNGTIYNRPKDKLEKLEKRKRRAQKRVTKDINHRLEISKRMKIKYEEVPISNRSNMRANKYRKICNKITNVKSNFYHNSIKEIILKNPEYIVIEKLSVRDMQRNTRNKSRKFRDELCHSDFYTIQTLIKKYCNKYNIPLIEADRNYQSSRICSNCGNIRNIGSHSTYICPACGLRIDRDINAAINLGRFAYPSK